MRLLLYTAVFLVLATGIVWTTHYAYKQPLSARSASDHNYTQLSVVNGVEHPPTEAVYPMEEDAICLLYTSPSPRDLSTSRMPSSA